MSFSRADQDLETSTIAQTVRDAMLYYSFTNNFYLGFGQSKLPGNRQRVISSGNLQMPDRSFVNQRMTIDRDFGFFSYWNIKAGNMNFNLKNALTTGDGRNALAINNGISHTHRLEWLPLGSFKDNGDYSEGDIAFEQTPKLSLGFTYSFNAKSLRTGGQLGIPLFQERNIETLIADMIFKYQGWAIQSEYLKRSTPNQHPITTELGINRFVYTGQGLNIQLSKMISSKTEVAIRYANIRPDMVIAQLDLARDGVLAGLTHYINGHRIKAQMFGGFEEAKAATSRSFWSLMFQVEFGI